MQDLIESGFASLAKASWQGAVLVILVLAVQWAFGPRLKPQWRYGLWLLVLIRLAVPWTVPSPMSLFNLLTFPSTVSSPGMLATENSPVLTTAQPVGPPATESPSAPTLNATATAQWNVNVWLLFGLWLAGALVLSIFLLVTHYRLSRKIGRQRPLIDAPVMNLLEDCKQQMGIHVPLTLVETTAVESPSLFGFVRPRLLLPAGMTQSFSLEELRYVFLHELGHIKRRDILVGWLMTALQILHWFNPLVWLAAHRMRVDRELACDALALSYGQADDNQRYGQTIIKLLESFGRSAWAPNLAGAVENKNQMKERIRMIAKFRKTNRGLALTVGLFAGLALITLTDAQSATSSSGKDLIGTWILVGTPGDTGGVPAVGGRLKSVTDTHWSITQADPETGATLFHHGGTWSLKGNEYSEQIDYANANTKSLVGNTFKFTFKVEDDTLTLIGVGNPWKEVWKRLKSDSSKPRKSELSAFQGTWHGQETGANDRGTATLVVRGSTFEFRGADANEWYKATFSAYDTTPKQMVTTITDCAIPEYVGRTAYAIYELRDGTLTVAGNGPGNPKVPSTLDARGARKFTFKQP